VGWAYTKVQSAWLKGFAQCVTGVTDALGRFWQNQIRNQKEDAMNTKHRHHSVDGRLASDGAPLGKKRLSGNWHITEYRVFPEPRAQSFEQVFRFDKEAKPMRWF